MAHRQGEHPTSAAGSSGGDGLQTALGTEAEQARARCRARLFGEIVPTAGAAKQASGVRTRSLGESHIDTANTLVRLSELDRVRGDYDAALRRLRAAREVFVDTLGRDHIRVAAIDENIGTTLRDLGDIEGARRSLLAARRVFDAHLSPEHPSVARIHRVLSTLPS